MTTPLVELIVSLVSMVALAWVARTMVKAETGPPPGHAGGPVSLPSDLLNGPGASCRCWACGWRS